MNKRAQASAMARPANIARRLKSCSSRPLPFPGHFDLQVMVQPMDPVNNKANLSLSFCLATNPCKFLCNRASN